MLNWVHLNLCMENAYKISILLKMNKIWDTALKRCLQSSGKWQKHSGETLASLEHQGMCQS